MADFADLEIGDSRVEFMALYILKTLKLKPDRWMKMYAIDDNKSMILEFVDKLEQCIIVFSVHQNGTLICSFSYPTQLKSKSCYFAKKFREAVPKDVNPKRTLMFGDLSFTPLDQLSALLDEVTFNKTKKKA